MKCIRASIARLLHKQTHIKPRARQVLWNRATAGNHLDASESQRFVSAPHLYIDIVLWSFSSRIHLKIGLFCGTACSVNMFAHTPSLQCCAKVLSQAHSSLFPLEHEKRVQRFVVTYRHWNSNSNRLKGRKFIFGQSEWRLTAVAEAQQMDAQCCGLSLHNDDVLNQKLHISIRPAATDFSAPSLCSLASLSFVSRFPFCKNGSLTPPIHWHHFWPLANHRCSSRRARSISSGLWWSFS